MIGQKSSHLRWRRATNLDIQALSDFLQEAEEERVGLSGRLLQKDGPLRLPSALRGAVWVSGDRAAAAGDSAAADAAAGDIARPSTPIQGAILCHPSRLVFPIFPKSPAPDDAPRIDRDIALLTASFAPASLIGMAADVLRYEAALGLQPRVSVAYKLMSLPAEAPRRRETGFSGLTVRRATAADLGALMPLQVAYEIEEVLTPIHSLNAAACKASLARALERQLIFVAEKEGMLVGKAGTNARGFHVDQVGGVFTLPALRGRGVAAALMSGLLDEILDGGRKPVLFVKPTNASARALYRSLGFEDIGDYRADYFEA